MRTGLSKKQKTTSVFFDEASPIIEVFTYNTSLKKRLSEYAAKYPVECRLVDDDENGCLTFEIRKGRFSFKLNAPYSAERRKAAVSYTHLDGYKRQTYGIVKVEGYT